MFIVSLSISYEEKRLDRYVNFPTLTWAFPTGIQEISNHLQDISLRHLLSRSCWGPTLAVSKTASGPGPGLHRSARSTRSLAAWWSSACSFHRSAPAPAPWLLHPWCCWTPGPAPSGKTPLCSGWMLRPDNTCLSGWRIAACNKMG